MDNDDDDDEKDQEEKAPAYEGPPKLVITGTKEAIPKARALVQEVVDQYRRENVSIDFDADAYGLVIGRGGAKIQQLQEETGVRLDVDKASGKIVLRGEEEKVGAAITVVQALLADYQKGTVVLANPNERGAIMGKGGVRIREIQETSGANCDLARDGSSVSASGEAAAVEKAISMINDFHQP